MMKTNAKVTSENSTSELGKILKDISDLEVYVGIPEAGAARPGDTYSNAQLLYLHTHGSPILHIPKRPVIEPAIEAEDHKEEIAEEFSLAAQAGLNGDREGMLRHLELAGQRGENAAHDWFEDPRNGWPPNSPVTIALKHGSDMPLIDTGELRKKIIHTVDEK